MGQLEVVPAWGPGTPRTVEMQEGDTLAFSFETATAVAGTIALVAADGREQRLRFGPDATEVSYTAPQSGPVGFRLAAKGRRFATFVTTCGPTRGSGTTMPEDLSIDASLALLLGEMVWKDRLATSAASRGTSSLKWLGGEQSGKETPTGTYGVNLKLQPALMVGVQAQFDPVAHPLLGTPALSDRPWLAGPVTSMQLGGGLTLDARAAWGSADPLMGHAADRQTLDARLTSKQEAGSWRFSPSVGFAHLQEKLATAAEHAADVRDQQTVESGRVDIKPEIAYRMDMGQSMYIEPKIVIGTFWNLGDAATASTATGAQHEARYMAEGGITFGAVDGTKLQVGGGVEEGPTRAENVWSGKVQVNIPLK
jgi:hypothetical protein